jgi:hypothetical protein
MISSQKGAVVPSNYIWDIQQIQQTQADPLLKELLIRMYQNIALIATVLNVKTTGQYLIGQTMDGNLWFPNPANNSSTAARPVQRPEARVVVNFGTLPNAGSKSVAHGITCTTSTLFTRIYATASDQSGFNYVPIPYASCTDAAHNIQIDVGSANVTITTGTDRTNFTQCLVVLEFLQT